MVQWFRDVVNFLNGFRKFTIMFFLIALSIGFRLSGHLSGSEVVELLRYTVVAFMATNGIEHISKAVMAWVKKKVAK